MTYQLNFNSPLQDDFGGSSHLINPDCGVSLYTPSWDRTHTWIRPCAAADPHNPGRVLPPMIQDPQTGMTMPSWRATLPPTVRGCGINKRVTFIDRCSDRPAGTTPYQRCRDWARTMIARDKNYEIFTKGSRGKTGYLPRAQSIYTIQGWMYCHKDKQQNPPRYVAMGLPFSASKALDTLMATIPDLVGPANGHLLDIVQASKLAATGQLAVPGMVTPGMPPMAGTIAGSDDDRSRYDVSSKQVFPIDESMMARAFIPFERMIRVLTTSEMVVAICDAFSDTPENSQWLAHFFRDSEFELMVPQGIRDRYFVSHQVQGYGGQPAPYGVQPGYPPQAAGYPPQAPGYPPQQVPGYPPQQAPGYPPQVPGYPPQQAPGYPPQAPPPSGFPGGYGPPPVTPSMPPMGYSTPHAVTPPPASPPPGMPSMQSTPPAPPPALGPVNPPAPPNLSDYQNTPQQAPAAPGYPPQAPGYPPQAPAAPGYPPQAPGYPPQQPQQSQQPQQAPGYPPQQQQAPAAPGYPPQQPQQAPPPFPGGATYQSPGQPQQHVAQGGTPPPPPGMNNPGVADSMARLQSVVQAGQQFGQQQPGLTGTPPNPPHNG